MVVVGAAVTGLEACRRDPEGTRRVNVEGTLRCVEQARRDGAFVVWLSSNLVFDGEVPRVKDGTPVSPGCDYGRQKAEVEEALAGDAGVARVRLTKVIGPGWKLLEDWCRTWEAGGAVRAFEDLWVAPVTLEATVQGLLKIAGERRGGGWQFSGPEDVSYAGLARTMAGKVGVGEDRVEGVGRGGVVRDEQAPRHTTLDTQRAEEELGMQFSGVDEVLDVWLATRRIRAMDITQGGVV
jgi:dTDP-4-dehydrorhamnose reductase